MTITLENLKADEVNLVNQLAQIQGMLQYNRQQQEFLKKKQEEQKPPSLGDEGTESPPIP